jgi:signal peptidase I
MRAGQLIRNGRAVRETYVEHIDPAEDPSTSEFAWQRAYVSRAVAETSAYYPSRDNWGPLVVPTHRFFVLGDNRDDSSDSRYWGFVPDSSITGSPLFVYFSYVPDSTTPWSWIAHVRWTRLGEVIR